VETRTIDGVLLVDKPAGVSSHDAVAVVRRILGQRRVGHAGTLDPFATGLMVMLAGRATRLLPYLDGEPKVYDATIRLGAETDTGDREGEIVREAAPPDDAAITTAIEALTGELDQVPPAYSAKRVDGVRAYARARRGESVALAPVRVHVQGWQVRQRRGPELDVTITCGGGTYVRALARDLGRLTGSAAHLTALQRVRSGRFRLADAQRLDALAAAGARLQPPVEAVAHLPAVALDERARDDVSHGRPIPASTDAPLVALVDAAGALVAVAAHEGDWWYPRVVLADG